MSFSSTSCSDDTTMTSATSLLDSASTAATAAAIAELQSQGMSEACAVAALAQLSSANGGGRCSFDDVAMPPVTPESTGDADSGVETKSVDIKSECDHSVADAKSEYDHSMMDADSGDEVPPAEPAPNAQVMDVRCGSLTGKLYEERFTCPGIHKKCIEFDGKLISPRQFTIRAEKDKQKDWKGSIRVGRYNLRTLMEMKKIDFYEHESNCSLKCQSRNYIKNRKQAAMETQLSMLDTIVKNNAALVAAANDLSDQPSSSTSFLASDFMASVTANDENGFNQSRKGSTALEEYVSRMSTYSNSSALAKMGIKPECTTPDLPASSQGTLPSTPTTTTTPQMQNLDSATLAYLQMMWKNPSGTQGGVKQVEPAESPLLDPKASPFHQMPGTPTLKAAFATPKAIAEQQQQQLLKSVELAGPSLRTIMEQNPLMFWERMRELGIADELTSQIALNLEHIRTLFKSSNHTTESYVAQKLSMIALALDLSDDFSRKIQTAYVQSTVQQQMQQQQKLAEEEKRKLEAKRNSEVMEQLLKLQSIDPSHLQILQSLLQLQQTNVDAKKIPLGI